MKQVPINDENKPSNLKDSNGRITRARTKALGSAGGLPPLHPSRKMDDKRIPRANSKRAASENNKTGVMSDTCSQHKKRAVLKDVTNVSCEKLYSNCINAARGQHSNLDKKSSTQKTGKAAPASFAKVQGNNRGKEVEEMSQIKVEESKAIGSTVTTKPAEVPSAKILGGASVIPKKMIFNGHIPLPSPSNRDYAEVLKFCCNQKNLEDRDIVDIDAQHHDPKMCSLYAADIYSSLHAKQFDHRPSMDYMGKLQQDITQGMRGILVDWLVEVSEEYTLVPDTLYLTVNLIDRFLSENYIEKQKLQLLGVTCMLIASKYEEICAPRVEEFCIITDNTYTKEEVMKMESRVLNLLGFKLSVPTTKNFLRRYIQAAQISYEVPSVQLEFLANYLAELTLTEYSFLKFLPSLIAASAVFLARWTLDQSDQPWNPTLEHYTGRKMFELKSVVLELQDLQLNTSGSMLNAIREKYKQSKFKAVSTLRSPKPVELLF